MSASLTYTNLFDSNTHDSLILQWSWKWPCANSSMSSYASLFYSSATISKSSIQRGKPPRTWFPSITFHFDLSKQWQYRARYRDFGDKESFAIFKLGWQFCCLWAWCSCLQIVTYRRRDRTTFGSNTTRTDAYSNFGQGIALLLGFACHGIVATGSERIFGVIIFQGRLLLNHDLIGNFC